MNLLLELVLVRKVPLLRDFHFLLLNKIDKVQECDATEDDKNYKCRRNKIKNLPLREVIKF